MLAAARPLPPDDEVLMDDLTEDEDRLVHRCRARRSDFGASEVRRSSTPGVSRRTSDAQRLGLLAARYRPLLEGRPAVISFVTVAELGYGARLAGWGPGSCVGWSTR